MLEHAILRRVVTAAVLLLFTWLSLSGQTQPSARSPFQKRFARTVDLTFHKGRQAKLPPHISTLLGIAQEQECSVMQGVERSGTIVQGIDVSTADKNNVVLFVVDETANDQTLYLTSAQGRLRKVVSVQAGVGAVSRITDKERKVFEKEKQFWVDRLVPTGPSK
jgi:hypothetical protein